MGDHDPKDNIIEALKVSQLDLRAQLRESEDARETLAELHESIASQLEAAGYVTPTPVAVEQLLAALKPYALGPLGEPFFKTKADAERALETVEREYGELQRQLREHQNCDPHRDCPPNAPCGMEASDGKSHGDCAAFKEEGSGGKGD